MFFFRLSGTLALYLSLFHLQAEGARNEERGPLACSAASILLLAPASGGECWTVSGAPLAWWGVSPIPSHPRDRLRKSKPPSAFRPAIANEEAHVRGKEGPPVPA